MGELPTGEELQIAHESALWNIISLFTLRQPATAAGIPDLVGWFRANASALAPKFSLDRLRATLRHTPIPEAHADYWRSLQRLVAIGRTTDALDLIGAHSVWLQWDGTVNPKDVGLDSQIAVLEPLTLLLRRFPSLRKTSREGSNASIVTGSSSREFDSAEEFLSYRRTWTQQCHELLQNQQMWERCASEAPETATGVQAVLRILVGDESAISLAVGTWAELLVALLLHVHPNVRTLAEVRQLLHKCVADSPPDSEFQHVTAAVLDAACDADMQSVMRAVSMIASDWFMAHVPALLVCHPAGATSMQAHLPHLGTTQEEFYTLEYAAALAPHASTSTLAASYLAWCPVYGRGAFTELIRRFSLSPGAAKAALCASALCEAHGLPELEASIWRRQGALDWQAGMVGAAVSCLVRIKDFERLDVVLKPVTGPESPMSTETAAALEADLSALPAESVHQSMLLLKLLLARGDGLSPAINLLRSLPAPHRRTCLGLLWPDIPRWRPSEVTADDALQLLQWLEEGVVGDVGAARLALVCLAAGAHILAVANYR